MKTNLYVALVSVIFLSGAIVISTGGWFLVTIGIFVFPIFLIVHCLVHVQAIRKKPRLRVILASHLLLLTAFLLRVDGGDASSFLAIDAVAWRLGIDFSAPNWMTGTFGQVLDLLLFLSVAVSWLFVFPFANPQLTGRVVVAILLPWWHFYAIGRPIAGILCFVLVLTTTGWIPASIWALFSLLGARTDVNAGKGPVAGSTD